MNLVINVLTSVSTVTKQKLESFHGPFLGWHLYAFCSRKRSVSPISLHPYFFSLCSLSHSHLCLVFLVCAFKKNLNCSTHQCSYLHLWFLWLLSCTWASSSSPLSPTPIPCTWDTLSLCTPSADGVELPAHLLISCTFIHVWIEG